MAARKTKRRSPGEGGAYPYKTKAGERWRAKGLVRQVDGTMKEVNKRGFPTKTAALEWLAEQQAAGRKGEWIEPSKRLLGGYGTEVIAGLRIGPQTRASYEKNWRLHVEPYPIARLQLPNVTGLRLTSHYRVLEQSGRKDRNAGGALSARTVRYLHTIIRKVLAQAVKDGLLARNPADAATPPTAREARPPEMHPWSAAQLSAFLDWSSRHSDNHAAWHVLAYSGMRRGELLALRWQDIDLDAGTVSVRRSVGVVKHKGQAREIVEGTTKTAKPRVVDLDPDTVAVLRAWKRERGLMALQLAQDAALAFGNIEGRFRDPETFSKVFKTAQRLCARELGPAAPPEIRLHDLRHTHATVLLTAREPVHVVSERLGHASPVVTMTVYAHVLPGSQREAAGTFARLIGEARTA